MNILGYNARTKKNDFLLKAIQEPNRSQSNLLALPMMKSTINNKKISYVRKKAETHQGCIHNYTFKSSTCTYHKCNNLTQVLDIGKYSLLESCFYHNGLSMFGELEKLYMDCFAQTINKISEFFSFNNWFNIILSFFRSKATFTV